VREWLPYKHFKAQVVAKLKFFGGFNMPKHVLLRDHAAAQACSDFEYEVEKRGGGGVLEVYWLFAVVLPLRSEMLKCFG